MPIFNNLFNKKQNKLLEAELSENGLAIGEISYNNKSRFSRIQLCFIRALLIFMASFGTVGAAVSAFDLPFMLPMVLIASLIICSYIAFLYYNRFTFYAGYILYFLLFTISIFSLYWYVNSGFQAYINTVYEKYSDHFALSTLREATEFITNRQLTVSVAMIFVVAFLALLLNIAISGYMSLIETFLVTFPLLQIGLYIDYKPDIIYLILLLGVYITVAVLGRSSHYRIPDFKNSSQDFLSVRNNKKGIKKVTHSYISDGRSIINTSVISIILCSVFLVLTSTIFYSDFGSQYAKNKLKDTTDEYVKMYIQNGIWGIFDRYSSKGGLNNGMLGGVSSVRPDYQTDIILQFVPINVNPIYLKAYEGTYYSYNLFTADTNLAASYSPDSYCIAEHIPSDDSQAKIILENIDAGLRYDYLPYYGVSVENKISDDYSTIYDGYYIPAKYVGMVNLGTADFPIVPANEPSLELANYAKDNCLYTPEYLNECLDAFIDETDLAQYKGALSEDLSLADRQRITIEIAETLRREYLANFSYTMAPGATPRSKDVIDFFLTTQKRGYCVHFASSSSMILRRLGVPTKYVEGYMVSLVDIMDAEAISTDTTGWVSEDIDLQFIETGVVSLDITDGSAHAWTEIYVDGYGWIPYEFTPPSDEDALTDFSLGSLFSSLFMTRPERDENDTATNNGEGGDHKARFSFVASFGFILYPMVCIIIFVIVLIFSIKLSRKVGKLLRIQHYYHRGDYQKALELSYALFHAYAKKKLDIHRFDITPTNMAKILLDLDIITADMCNRLDEAVNMVLYGCNNLDKAKYNDVNMILSECKKCIHNYKKPKDKKVIKK